MKHRKMILGRTGATLRIKMHLTLWKDGQTIVDTTKWVKSKIVSLVEATPFDKGYLKVTYSKDFHNDLDFYDVDTFKRALTDFTEKSLTDNFLKG
jgi:hypothetical protein